MVGTTTKSYVMFVDELLKGVNIGRRAWDHAGVGKKESWQLSFVMEIAIMAANNYSHSTTISIFIIVGWLYIIL